MDNLPTPTATVIGARKFLVAYPSGRCCFVQANGQRACTESDPATGTPYDSLPGWRRECDSGSFYVDRAGLRPGDSTPYEQSVLDLIAFVDANYRTLPLADVTRR